MQLSPTQSLYAPPPGRPGARPAQTAGTARSSPPPASSTPQPNAAGVVSAMTPDGLKASYSQASMSYKIKDTKTGTSLIAYGSNAAAEFDGKRGIAAAVSPNQDVIVESGNQSVALGNLADPATAQKLRSFFSSAQCDDLLIAARTHDLAQTSLGRRVVKGAPDWLKSVHDKQMFDPRVLNLPPVKRAIERMKSQSAARADGPPPSIADDPNASIEQLQAQIAADTSATREAKALTAAYNPKSDDSSGAADS